MNMRKYWGICEILMNMRKYWGMRNPQDIKEYAEILRNPYIGKKLNIFREIKEYPDILKNPREYWQTCLRESSGLYPGWECCRRINHPTTFIQPRNPSVVQRFPAEIHVRCILGCRYITHEIMYSPLRILQGFPRIMTVYKPYFNFEIICGIWLPT